MTQFSDNITIVPSNEGQGLAIAGNCYRTIISGKQTGGSYAMIDMLVAPGGGPNPHSHPDIQESFYVMEGQVVFKSESGHTVLSKGDIINIPLGGAIHCFKNQTDSVARLLCTVTPAGLEDLFEELGTPVPYGTFLPMTPPSEELKQKIKILSDKYNQVMYPPDYLDK